MTENNDNIINMPINMPDILNDDIKSVSVPDSISNGSLNMVKTKLVLSGGGIKGIAHLGALCALHELDILKNITVYAGTSVGALIIVLIVIGYIPNEIYDVIRLLNIENMKDLNISNLLSLYGLDDGKRMEIVIVKLLNYKQINENITFLQLFEKTNKTIYITVSCINDKKAYYFSHLTKPNMKILDAIKMSIAIPIFFIPINYENKLYIDGACIDNYPIHIFDDLENVIGIYIKDVSNTIDNIGNIEDVLIHTIQCLLEGVTQNAIRNYEKYSCILHISNISSIQLNIDKETKQKLFDIGYNTCMEKYKIKNN